MVFTGINVTSLSVIQTVNCDHSDNWNWLAFVFGPFLKDIRIQERFRALDILKNPQRIELWIHVLTFWKVILCSHWFVRKLNMNQQRWLDLNWMSIDGLVDLFEALLVGFSLRGLKVALNKKMDDGGSHR